MSDQDEAMPRLERIALLTAAIAAAGPRGTKPPGAWMERVLAEVPYLNEAIRNRGDMPSRIELAAKAMRHTGILISVEKHATVDKMVLTFLPLSGKYAGKWIDPREKAKKGGPPPYAEKEKGYEPYFEIWRTKFLHLPDGGADRPGMPQLVERLHGLIGQAVVYIGRKDQNDYREFESIVAAPADIPRDHAEWAAEVLAIAGMSLPERPSRQERQQARQDPEERPAPRQTEQRRPAAPPVDDSDAEAAQGPPPAPVLDEVRKAALFLRGKALNDKHRAALNEFVAANRPDLDLLESKIAEFENAEASAAAAAEPRTWTEKDEAPFTDPPPAADAELATSVPATVELPADLVDLLTMVDDAFGLYEMTGSEEPSTEAMEQLAAARKCLTVVQKAPLAAWAKDVWGMKSYLAPQTWLELEAVAIAFRAILQGEPLPVPEPAEA